MQTTNRKEKTTIKVICQSVVVVDMIMNAAEPIAQHGLWNSFWEGLARRPIGEPTTNPLTIGISAENQWVYLFNCQS